MKVIVAVDDSPVSEEVIASIKNRSWPESTEFRILTVLEQIPDSMEERDETLPELSKYRKKIADRLCKRIRKDVEDTTPGAHVHYEIRTGSPKQEIIGAAVEWSADKILIGAHGSRSCPHNLLGSISRAVASHAPCSVEIIREKANKKSRKLKD